MSDTINTPGDAPVRLAHFSDIHVTATRLGWRPRDLLGKRFTGWFNLNWLGRGRHFLSTEAVVTALVGELRRAPPDRVVFSGDATALGFEAEFARAAHLLGLTEPNPLPGLAVPGNHDHYVRGTVRAGWFEHHFAPWLEGERVDGATYPFAQRAGHLWLVAVNTSAPNWLPWDATGRAGPQQLARLEALLRQLPAGPRILVTHYPVCGDQGQAETRTHSLRDLARLVEVAARGGVGLWLHGHRHAAYHHPTSSLAPFPVVCAGSATHKGLWSYKQYTVTGRHLVARRRTYDPDLGAFRDDRSFELTLPG
jgi:3',5'-cyclic AMP phosphodiesterase CpdA